MISRRALVGGLGPTAALASLGAMAGCGPVPSTAFRSTPMKTLAARSGRGFGSEVAYAELESDPAYAAIVAAQCSQITPGIELKWGFFQPSPFDFHSGPAEWLLQWAQAAGISVRGHTLLWHVNQPRWALGALREDARTTVSNRITETMGAFKGRITEWDVVNEGIEPRDGRADGLRNSIFLDTLGPGYIGDAFGIAHQTDPDAKLYYNEFGVEYANADNERRRTALLKLLERLVHDGVPIHGLGIQGHIYADRPLDERAFRGFLSAVAGMGLLVKITEFDIRDHFAVLGGLGGMNTRILDTVTRYFDIVLDCPAVAGVVTWGLSDRYSDLRTTNRWDRPLPYDVNLLPKPMRDAMAGAFVNTKVAHR